MFFPRQLRKIVMENFEEWGPLDNVHLVPAKTLAFVRWAGPGWRGSARWHMRHRH